MNKVFFITGLLVLLATCVLAQEKTSHDITITKEIPEAWGRSVEAVITLSDANRIKVKTFRKNIRVNTPVTVDVRSLKVGTYIVKVKPGKELGLPGELIFDMKKSAGDNRLVLAFSACMEKPDRPMVAKKPVIYLYPEQVEDVVVKVDFKGELTETIPEYQGGWKVSAAPDGKITNYADGKHYPYLFWEGNSDKRDWNMKEGFVVSKDSCRVFLEHQLLKMGLVAKEYNEFIDFWLPMLQKNEYNLIHFTGREYEDLATLTVDPKPDAILRVFMVFKPADKKTPVIPQHFKNFVRKGFTVIEWGGMELDTPATTLTP